MLDPGNLAELTGRQVQTVDRQPFHSVDGHSGAKMWRVLANDGEQYILKRVSYSQDWIMQVTDDRRCRAVLAWTTGLLDRLPAHIAHETLACACDGDGWAILLRDVGPALIPPGDDAVSVGDNEQLLDAMAALNAAFWDEPDAADPALGFASLSTVISSSLTKRFGPC